MTQRWQKMFMSLGILAATCTAAAQVRVDVKVIDKRRVLAAAAKFLDEMPATVTAYPAPRSSGGIHDFFSEGDYWWPDPKQPDGPYVQRDGMSNPENFVRHRQAMVRFSIGAAALAAAYKITAEEKYASQAVRHLRAWFVDEPTRMSPHLKFAQAIKGRTSGRGIGIIDTIHLIEVARSVEALAQSKALSAGDLREIKDWFSAYLEWMTTHPNGIEEREAKNNHGTCWVMQVAAFAHLVGDEAKLDYCRTRFKTVLMPNQMGADGSFPLELKRTKPYNYSLFNLDAMAMICLMLSTEKDNLWQFTLPDGRNMRKALDFMYPYIADKSRWTYPADVMCFEFYPVRHPSLLFAGLAHNEQRYIDLWKKLEADPTNEEVIRNFPIRQPVLWTN